jgi:hypothetical protein
MEEREDLQQILDKDVDVDEGDEVKGEWVGLDHS